MWGQDTENVSKDKLDLAFVLQYVLMNEWKMNEQQGVETRNERIIHSLVFVRLQLTC